MKTILCIWLLLISNCCVARFFMVQSKDGYCNVRQEIGQSTIIDKLPNGFIVYQLESEGNWREVSYQKNGQEITGRIFHNQLTDVAALTKIPVISQSANKLVLSKSGVEVTMLTKKFNASKHRYSAEKAQQFGLTLMDGKPFWGTDGNLPKAEYSVLEIKVNNKPIKVPVTAYSDLYEPTFDSVLVNYDRKKDLLLIQTLNSDGAGAYAVAWKFERGNYISRSVVHPF